MRALFKPAVAALVFSTAIFHAQAQNAAQTLVLEQSSIEFSATQMGVPMQGKFQKFTGDIQFNPQDTGKSKIALKIDMASATLGDAATDKNLRDDDWFGVRKFAQATFDAQTIKALSKNQYQIDGELKIKDKTKKITVPVQLEQSGAHTTARGTFQLGRLDFDIGQGDWADTSMIANEVKVNFKLVLTGVNKL